jgi:membrane protein implicated in regulation of membrane protease activity
MAWWGWIAAGALLLAAEMGFVDAQFYLVFLGLSALLVGLLALAGLEGPVWLQWLLFAGFSAASFGLFRGRVYARLQRGSAGRPEGLQGEAVVASERIEAGARGRAELRGAQWTVVNAGPAPLASGDRARVVRADGLVLHVRAEDGSPGR